MVLKLHKCLRGIRIERGELLKEMAEKLYMPPADLSAIEHGKKPVPDNLFINIETAYDLQAETIKERLLMEELKIAETKGLQDVRVFEVNEYDAVAAYYAEDAVEFYQNEIDDPEDACYPIEDVEEVSKEKQILKYENSEETESVAEIISARWEGKPFIVYTSH